MKQTTSEKKRAKDKAGKKKIPRKRAEEFNDLCTTCNHFDGCINAKEHQRPIHNCEEFDSYTQLVEEPAVEAQPKEVKAEDTKKYIGICINCDHREDCMHSSTEGGIWHCEEYS